MKNGLKHLAIIPDGNRRWAKVNRVSILSAYKAGIQTLKQVIKQCLVHQIPFVSVYGLSTENTKQRSKSALISLLNSFFHAKEHQQLVDFFITHHIRCHLVGDLSFFSPSHQKFLKKLSEPAINQPALTVLLHINYGGKQEILAAVNHCLLNHGQKTPLTLDDFCGHFNSHGAPSPDLLLRTGGYARLSNYLLWHIDYTEIYFEPCLWSDFNNELFEKMYQWFHQQQRNFGQ